MELPLLDACEVQLRWTGIKELVQGVSKRALQLLKLIYIYSDMYSVLNCNNVTKHTEFFMGQLRLNVTSTGNAGCFEKSFTVVLQMLLRGECYENTYT
jgi:hypothetical protein